MRQYHSCVRRRKNIGRLVPHYRYLFDGGITLGNGGEKPRFCLGLEHELAVSRFEFSESQENKKYFAIEYWGIWSYNSQIKYAEIHYYGALQGLRHQQTGRRKMVRILSYSFWC